MSDYYDSRTQVAVTCSITCFFSAIVYSPELVGLWQTRVYRYCDSLVSQ